MNDDRLQLHLDGRLPPDEARALEERLRTDAALREQFDQLRRVRRAFQEVFTEPPEVKFEEFWRGVEARLGEQATESEAEPLLERARSWWQWLWQPAVGWSFAGAAAVVLVAFLLWGRGGAVQEPGQGGEPGAPLVAAQQAGGVEAPQPGRRRELGEERRPQVVVESYRVQQGVVVVNRPVGSDKWPLVIWHLVPGEEDDAGGAGEDRRL
jgi:anti-sigma factor RsiW